MKAYYITDEEVEKIKKGVLLNLEYYLNETDNGEESYGPCGGFETEIESHLAILKALKIQEYDEYLKIWNKRKEEFELFTNN